jgi:hypothetical protein
MPVNRRFRVPPDTDATVLKRSITSVMAGKFGTEVVRNEDVTAPVAIIIRKASPKPLPGFARPTLSKPLRNAGCHRCGKPVAQ